MHTRGSRRRPGLTGRDRILHGRVGIVALRLRRNDSLRMADDPAARRGVGGRTGVLRDGYATALSTVGVVCHDVADYQYGAIGDAPVDPPERMNAQVVRV